MNYNTNDLMFLHTYFEKNWFDQALGDRSVRVKKRKGCFKGADYGRSM
jgi:hypothetical protein